MAECTSEYTIGRGEVLQCELDRHAAAGFRGLVHMATWSGTRLVWNDSEADR